MLTIGTMKIYCFKCHKSCLVRLHTNPTTWMKNEKAMGTSPLPVLLCQCLVIMLLCCGFSRGQFSDSSEGVSFVTK